MMGLTYEWDEAKRRSNIIKHGVDFNAMRAFDWGGAMVQRDDAHDEQRWMATGFIDLGLYVVVYTEPGENRIRIISLRKASKREEISYVQVSEGGG